MTHHVKNLLLSRVNPHKNKTYTVSIIQKITLNHQVFLFGLRYIPDKLLLDHGSLVTYLEAVLAGNSEQAEIVTHDIGEDVMDQIIPKWLEINLKQGQNNAGQTILVTIEDRQPNWESPPLLKRLPPLF